MDIKHIRRFNLLGLIGEYIYNGYSKSQFAEKIGIPPSQLSQLASNNAVRNIGDKIARRIETKLDLPYGWLDQPKDIANLNIYVAQEESKSSPVFSQNSNATPLESTYKIETICTDSELAENDNNSTIFKSIELYPEEARRLFGGRESSFLKMVTVKGDSMLGTLSPGDLVIIDMSVQSVISDGIYAFVYAQNMHIKRIQRVKDQLLVISDNQSYEKWLIKPDEQSDFHIQGLVIGNWKMSFARLG